VLGACAAASGLLLTSTWLGTQVPAAGEPSPTPATAQPAPVPATIPTAARDAQAALFVGRLSAASGRSLEMLAAQVTDALADPMEELAPTVTGATQASEKYAETLAQLDEAEQAAAEQLAQTEEDVLRAEAERDQAAQDLAQEEAEAARQVDAAIEAAISAARAQSTASIDDLAFGGGGGTIPQGAGTSTGEVLALVRKYFPADQVGNAMAVARCESGHANRVSKPNGNGSRDFGVFQINDGGTIQAALRRLGVRFSDISDARAKALDPAMNVRMARTIWESRGWQPWVCAAKLKIVAGLYQRAPGPMDGKFDEVGRAR
jgi:hypothetical protein